MLNLTEIDATRERATTATPSRGRWSSRSSAARRAAAPTWRCSPAPSSSWIRSTWRRRRMHRTRVRVAEEALDANTTIAQANRADFDRESVAVVNLMSAPGAGKTSLLEAVFREGLGDVRPGVLEGDVQGSLDADRLSHYHVPVTQLNTDGGFGGECHLDANMVRTALPEVGPRRDRPADHRERGQPGLPGRVPRGRGRQGDGVLGDRGRGQAAEVPADVPHLRAGGGEQDRPAAAPRLRPRRAAAQHRVGEPGRGGAPDAAPARARASTAFREWLAGVGARAKAVA